MLVLYDFYDRPHCVVLTFAHHSARHATALLQVHLPLPLKPLRIMPLPIPRVPAHIL